MGGSTFRYHLWASSVLISCKSHRQLTILSISAPCQAVPGHRVGNRCRLGCGGEVESKLGADVQSFIRTMHTYIRGKRGIFPEQS